MPKRSPPPPRRSRRIRSEEHTSELQSLLRLSYAVFCLKKKIEETNNKQQLLISLTYATFRLINNITTVFSFLEFSDYVILFLCCVIFWLFLYSMVISLVYVIFFFNDTATTEIYTY